MRSYRYVRLRDSALFHIESYFIGSCSDKMPGITGSVRPKLYKFIYLS